MKDNSSNQYADMRNALSIVLWTAAGFLTGCGGGPSTAPSSAMPEENAPPEEPRVDEDQLILRLSLDLIAAPRSRAEEEQNDIVNYAIDEILDIRRTDSGLYYQIMEAGTGDTLQWGDRVRVHYRGYFLDGREFDSSYRRDKPIDFYIGNMIPGWNEGLQLLNVGAKARLLIPSHLGYGEEGMKDGEKVLVPPNSVLVFELEVLKKLS